MRYNEYTIFGNKERIYALKLKESSSLSKKKKEGIS